MIDMSPSSSGHQRRASIVIDFDPIKDEELFTKGLIKPAKEGKTDFSMDFIAKQLKPSYSKINQFDSKMDEHLESKAGFKRK